MPYTGGNMIHNRGQVQSTQDSIQYWVNHNQCDPTPLVTQYPNHSKADRSWAFRTTYRNPKTNIEVSLIRIVGGGHAEPSIQQPYSRLLLTLLGRQNQDIEMADEIWSFFQNKSNAFIQ